MLSKRIRLAMTVAVVTCAAGRTASGQFYGDGCNACGAAMPMTAAATCTPIQPVYTSCYQTVPVTTYAQVKQTVQVPYYETAYEDRQVTVYRPVTTQREVEIPTVTYQNVVENRTINRDMGRWVTRYQPVPKCAPCQVDPRPGVIGWLNRSGYAFRTAFTPNYTSSREYVPNMVSCTVPYTRQVAVQGSRRVTMSETKMVAEVKNERIPVQKLAYRSEERTVMQPQTAFRTVPIGTAMAYGPSGFGGTTTAYYPYGGAAMAYGVPVISGASPRTALAPVPDSNFNNGNGSNATGTFPADGPTRSTENSFRRDEPSSSGAAGGSGGNFQRSSMEIRTFPQDGQSSGAQEPDLSFPAGDGFGPTTDRRNGGSLVIPASHESASRPVSAATAGSGWRASRAGNSGRGITGSGLPAARVSLADNSATQK